ncbi:MAG: class I SAM-dependent methyltransferase [Dehalococcoidia bacterium]|nr:MAG: class I SAM-dependent methyltransferase [Dehalococcoidia bacterium]
MDEVLLVVIRLGLPVAILFGIGYLLQRRYRPVEMGSSKASSNPSFLLPDEDPDEEAEFRHYAKRKQRSRFPQKSGNGAVAERLLAEMDAYHWDSVDDIAISKEQKRQKLKYFREILNDSGMNLSGSVLDLASGPISLAYLYHDTVAVDSDPACIKSVRQNKIKGVIATIPDLPFEENSFDYVTCINPDLAKRVPDGDSVVKVSYDREFSKQLVEAALKIARKKVLIVSFDLSRFPPHEQWIEKRVVQPLYYVVYRAKWKR